MSSNYFLHEYKALICIFLKHTVHNFWGDTWTELVESAILNAYSSVKQEPTESIDVSMQKNKVAQELDKNTTINYSDESLEDSRSLGY